MTIIEDKTYLEKISNLSVGDIFEVGGARHLMLGRMEHVYLAFNIAFNIHLNKQVEISDNTEVIVLKRRDDIRFRHVEFTFSDIEVGKSYYIGYGYEYIKITDSTAYSIHDDTVVSPDMNTCVVPYKDVHLKL